LSPELTGFLASAVGHIVVFCVGMVAGRHLMAKHLTSVPCPRTGVCGPYEVEGRFYYVVPQAQWERLKESVLRPREYDS
jgi:hypothetical protein